MAEKKLQKSSSKTIPRIAKHEEEKFMAFIKQVEIGSYDKLDASHITEVLAQRKQVNEFIHEENMQEHERFKIIQRDSLAQLIVVIAFALIILVMVAIVDKNYLPEALSLVVGFIGGFGVGKTFKEYSRKEN